MAAYNIIYGDVTDTYADGFSTVYSTARATTTTTSGAVDSASAAGAVSNTFSTPNYFCAQAFFVFDTSTVPSGSGTGLFSVSIGNFGGNANADKVRIREVSSVSNKIAGASLSALTLHADPNTFPTATGRYTAAVSSVAAIPRSATFRVVMHTVGEENGTVPTGINRFGVRFADTAGTTDDPFLSLIVGAWEFVGVSNVVEVTATPHALVTTGITGLAAGDLLVACISSRIASTTSITLPTGGEWTLVSEQKNNNTTASTSGIASGLMAYCVRGASNPNLTFTHPVAPSVALGRIVAYRNVNTASPKDTQTSFTTPTVTLNVSGTGLTTTQIEDLVVAMVGGGQEAAWSAFNATDPIGASGATVTTAPTTTWSERADSLTTTGADTSLAIFDAVKLTSGATGNLTATASIGGGHVVIAGAFKIAVAAPASVTGTGAPAAQAGDTDGAGVSGSAGVGTPAGRSATVSSIGGVSGSVGTGTPAAQAAAVGGSGSVGAAAATGTGAIAADAVAVSGSGVSASVAIGTLTAQSATTAGAGTVASTGTGALAAQDSTVTGSGLSSSVGTGALQAAAAVVVGAGASASAGTGSLVAGSAEIAGAGTAAAANSGALVAEAAAVAGLGVSESTGSGALQAGASAIAGAGRVAAVGTGDLVAGAATVTGEGVVIAAGAAVGTGALEAGAATIAGAGEVTGEVAPPVSAAIGGHWRPEPHRPPPVEGVGYVILPQIEGEAHGVVLAAGAGAAPAPRISGVGTGAVGIDGRSAAQFTAIKAAAVGDRGELGAARAMLKAAAASGAGVAGAYGTGAATIRLKGAAIGRHDDDEAAILALLLAA